MNKTYRFSMIVAVALALVTIGCSSDSDEDNGLMDVGEGVVDSEGSDENKDKVDNTRYDLVLAEGETEIVSGYNRQSLAFLDKLAEGTGDNIYTSPMSLNILLSMFANGVTGDARDEVLDYLGGTSLSTVNAFNTKLMDELVKLDKELDFTIANSLWATPGFSFLPSYRDLMDASYHASFYDKVPLSTTEGRNAINQWCSEKTNGLIPLFLEEPLDPETPYFLVNALYFKGKWSRPFDKSLTSPRPFNAADGTTQIVSFMEGSRNVRNLEKDGTQFVEIPFGNQAFVLDLFMPAEGFSVKDLLADTRIISILDEASESSVRVRIPKFKIKYNRDNLKGVLVGLGLTKLFDKADFSDMTSADVKKVDVIRQKNVFEINEESVEAATVTGGDSATSLEPGNDPIISFDRPFMFIVRESSTGLFVSLGVVNKI